MKQVLFLTTIATMLAAPAYADQGYVLLGTASGNDVGMPQRPAELAPAVPPSPPSNRIRRIQPYNDPRAALKASPEKVHTERLLGTAIVQGSIQAATQYPNQAPTQESQITYAYVPNAVYTVYAAPDNITDIVLQPGEKLNSVLAGDTVRWITGKTTSGAGAETQTHVIIKPTQPGLETNLLITTDRHAYRVNARSTPNFFMPAIAWSYPQEEMNQLVALQAHQQRMDAQKVTPDNIRPESLNFKYKITAKGDYGWTPVRVFDDGKKTYIEMAPSMQSTEAPALFLRQGKALNLINYRVAGDYYVVDRLLTHAELRAGQHDRVIITKIVPHRWHWFWERDNDSDSNDDSNG